MITVADVKRLEYLAKIKCASEELEYLVRDLNSIVKMLDQLHCIDASSHDAQRSSCVQILNRANSLIQGAVKQDQSDCDLFSCVPQQESNLAKNVKCFVVPKSIE